MKSAIVTGANGFIGHHFIKELSDKGYHIWAIVKNEQENIENIKDISNVEIIYCDLNNIKTLAEMINIDSKECVFYHLAWAGNSGHLRGNYELQLLNAKYTVDTAIVAKKIGCSRIVVSGSVTQLMYRDYLRRDEFAPDIVTCYAIGKMCAEAMLKCVCYNIGLDLCWAYIANFYGEDDSTNNFINFLINHYMQKKTPELTPAEQPADFMHVSDVARALRILGERGKKRTSYYIGYGSPRPLKEYIQIIHDKIAPDISSGIGLKHFAGENIDFEAIDYQKFSRDTGFKPLISFEDGISQVINKKINGV